MSFRATLLVQTAGTFGRPDLDETGKVILPHGAVNKIISSGFNDSVMLFLLKNPITQKSIAVGVEEFSADDVSCVVPRWVLKYLALTENDKILVQLQRFPKCTECIFQPLDESFMKLDSPRVVLEHSLRKIPCLTQGSILELPFASKTYYLKVLFLKPEKMVCAISADVITQFARPLDEFDHKWGEEEEYNESHSLPKSDDPFKGTARKL